MMTDTKLKVAFLNDYNIKEFQGGATISIKIMMAEGKRLGHEVELFTYNNLPTDDYLNKLDKFDLIVLNNVSYFDLPLISKLIKTKKYITYNHDYGYCEKRNGMCGKNHGDCIPAPIFREMFAKSQLNIFFSPLQLNIHKAKFGQVLRDAICIPAPIESGKFWEDKNVQRDAYLYAGAIATHKGVGQIIEFADENKDKIFHFAGKAINKELVEQIKEKHHYLGEIPHEEMPKLYRKYKHFIINPLMPETFCHSILEAMSSGCSIIKFEKSLETGLESYGKSITEMLTMCIKAPEMFWEKIWTM